MARPGTWPPGVSGNPAGRPPRKRALTEILAKAGNEKVDTPEGKVARKKLAARYWWQFITEGQVTFANGTVLKPFGMRDYVNALKELYKHIDGAPDVSLDLTSGGQTIKINVDIAEDEDGE